MERSDQLAIFRITGSCDCAGIDNAQICFSILGHNLVAMLAQLMS